MPDHSRAALAAVLLALAACSPSPAAPVTGEISDTAITVNAVAAPANSWFELTNVGANPCNLVVIVTETPPTELPIANGMVQVDALGEGTSVDAVDSAVQPGTLARWQEQLPTDPGAQVAGARLIICNNPGDFQAGRYVILPISPL